MQWKQSAEDFQVHEAVRLSPGRKGDFALYLLEKQEIGTHEALAQISRELSVPAFRIDHGGLKDRTAQTSQYITIHNGPRRSIDQKQWQLQYLGLCDRKMHAGEITGNEFTIVLRQMEALTEDQLQQTCHFLSKVGVPNYFDDQRFGSLTDAGKFVAVAWMKKDYERALKQALAEPNSRDPQAEALQRKILRSHWGDWMHCKMALDKSNRRSVVTYLCDHPEGFKKAFGLVSSEMRGLYLSAFQSHVWNQVIANRILAQSGQTQSAQTQSVEFRPGALPMPANWESPPEWSDDLIPLPSGRLRLGESNRLRKEFEAVLQQWDIPLPLMRVSFPRDVFFATAKRKTWLTISSVEANCQPDDLHPGQSKVTLKFTLPSGCYATLVLKQLERVWNPSAP